MTPALLLLAFEVFRCVLVGFCLWLLVNVHKNRRFQTNKDGKVEPVGLENWVAIGTGMVLVGVLVFVLCSTSKRTNDWVSKLPKELPASSGSSASAPSMAPASASAARSGGCVCSAQCPPGP